MHGETVKLKKKKFTAMSELNVKASRENHGKSYSGV